MFERLAQAFTDFGNAMGDMFTPADTRSYMARMRRDMDAQSKMSPVELMAQDWRRVGDNLGNVLGVKRGKNGRWVPIRGEDPSP